MALTLTRKDGESLYLILEDGREIAIQVESYSPGTTTVRVTAPLSIQVLREELMATEA